MRTPACPQGGGPGSPPDALLRARAADALHLDAAASRWTVRRGAAAGDAFPGPLSALDAHPSRSAVGIAKTAGALGARSGSGRRPAQVGRGGVEGDLSLIHISE